MTSSPPCSPIADGTDILIAARSFVAHPLLWCQGQLHDAGNNRACAMGALQWASSQKVVENVTTVDAHLRLQEAAFRLYGKQCVAYVNDVEGRDAILACFDLAIGPDRLHETNHQQHRRTETPLAPPVEVTL